MTTQTKAPLLSYERKGYRNYVLILLTFVYCVNILDRQVLSILMPAIKADMDLTDTQLGFLSGIAFALLYSTIGIPIASWADRGNRRNILSLAIAVWSVMTVACGMAQNFVHLILARVGVGVGEAGGTPPSHSIIVDIFPEKVRATAIAIHALGAQAGVLLGLVLGGWLSLHFDWRMAFIIVGAPGLIVAVIVKFSLKEPARSKEYLAVREKNQPSIKEAAQWLFSFSSFRHLGAGAALISVVSYGFGQWVPSFLMRGFDISIGTVGLSLGIVLGIGGGIGTFLGGFVADKLSARGDRRWYVWLPAICCLLYVPLSWPIYFSQSVEWTIAFMFLPVLLAVSFYGPIYASMQGLAGPNRRAMGSGIMLLLVNLFGLGLGPQIVGIVSDLLIPAWGDRSLQYALLIVTSIGAAWAGFHFLMASRYLRADLDRAANSHAEQGAGS